MVKISWKKLTLLGVVVCGTQLFLFFKISGLNHQLLNLFSSKPSSFHVQEEGSSQKDLPVRPEESEALGERTTINGQNGAVIEVTNLTDPIVLVNKHRYLPEGYAPGDLVQPNIPFSFAGKSQKKLMRKEAAQALERLFKQAKIDHIDLVGVSAYRSFESQNAIFKGNVRQQGEDAAKRVSAVPGYSEHQTGLAIDVSTPGIGNVLEPAFGETAEGKWLAQNAPDYGFIIRYPKGKETITGYTYEPWHIRYVGMKSAKMISQQNITLEEYLDHKQ